MNIFRATEVCDLFLQQVVPFDLIQIFIGTNKYYWEVKFVKKNQTQISKVP